MRISVRSWLVRGLILAGVAAVVACGWVASTWVSPEHVREKVLTHLTDQFQGVQVHVGSARMRILGGIAVTDLRLVRQGDPPDQPFLVVPSAVIYHDKEQLNRGRLIVRKVELENPEVHLVRLPDGKWNLAEVLKAGPADHPVPTFVTKGATVTVSDQMPNGFSPFKLTNLRLTLLNDPLPVLGVEGQATIEQFGSVHVRGGVNRVTNQLWIGVDLPELPIDQSTTTVASRLVPDLAPHLSGFSGTASVKADLAFTPDTTPAWRHDIRVEIKGGRFENPSLPWPIEQIAAKVRSLDGRVKVDEATARFGPAQLKLSLETRPISPTYEENLGTGDVLQALEVHLQKLELTAAGVPLDDTLFGRIGVKGEKVRRMFSPVGSVDIGYKFSRESVGWKREFELRPRVLSITYEKFRYPLTEIRGWIKRTATHVGEEATVLDLRGTAGGRPITLKGQLHGEGPDPAVNLEISGTDVPLDDKLIAALPGKYPAVVSEFRAAGRGDIVAKIVQDHGVNLARNEFRIEVRDGSVNYQKFPYPFTKVRGRLVIRTMVTDPTRPLRPGEPLRPLPESDELILDGFTAEHAGATIWLHGSKRPIPGSTDRKLLLQIGGNHCPIDADLHTALGALKLDALCKTFAPRGTLTFAADVEVLDRGPVPGQPTEPEFDPASDLKLTFNFSGPTITPTFFPYELTDLSGWLEYRSGRLDLAHFAGRHGDSRLRLAAGEVRFYPDGVVWANLGGLHVKPLLPDDAFLKALPAKLGGGVKEIQLRGQVELAVKHLVILTPPDAPKLQPLPPPEPLPVPIVPRTARVPSTPVGRAQAPPDALPLPTPRPLSTPEPDPVVYWDAELKLLGASLNTGLQWDEVFGTLACRGRYEGTHMGLLRGNVWLDRAVIARQPFAGLKSHVRSQPQLPDPARPGEFLPPEVTFSDIAGTLFHGTIGGEARIVLTDAVRYELWLTAADVQLSEVAQHYKLGSDADLKGVAQAQVRVYNRPDPRNGQLITEGAGRIDVPTGRMYNLPILLDLLKMLKLQAPDKTAFEEAHATFRLSGDRVYVDQLDLIGKAVCLGGAGELSTDGVYVRFDFYTLVSQVLARMVNTPVGDVTAFLSKNLFKIKMTRKNGKLEYEPEPVPVITEPVKAVTERLRGRFSRMMGK